MRTKARITPGQRWNRTISVSMAGRKSPATVLVDDDLEQAIERAARSDDRSVAGYLRLLAIRDTVGRGLYDPTSTDGRSLAEAIAIAQKLDDRAESAYFRQLAIRDLTAKGLYQQPVP